MLGTELSQEFRSNVWVIAHQKIKLQMVSKLHQAPRICQQKDGYFVVLFGNLACWQNHWHWEEIKGKYAPRSFSQEEDVEVEFCLTKTFGNPSQICLGMWVLFLGANYSGLSRGHPHWWFSKRIPSKRLEQFRFRNDRYVPPYLL